MKLLIDGNTILFRNFYIHTTKKIYNVNNPTLIGFIRTISKYKRLYKVKNNEIIITFDKGKSKYRKRLLRSYKLNRKEQRKKNNFNWELYIKQFEDIINVLKNIFKIIIIKDYEGDDIISYYTINNPDKNIIIISNDKDLLQLIYNDNIIFHNIYNDNIISFYNYKDYTGYNNYKNFLLYKILYGDKSDNIDKIYNIKDINKIIEDYNNIDNYLKYIKNKDNNIYKIIKLNRMLIDLYYFQDKFGKYLKDKIKKEEDKYIYNPHVGIKYYKEINGNRHLTYLEDLIYSG